MIGVTGVGRTACVVALLAGPALAGCGSNDVSVATGGTAAPSLPPTPSSVPSDYTSLTAIEDQLGAVANCTDSSSASSLCTLVTTTTATSQISAIRPFAIKIFPSTAAAAQYVQLVQQENLSRASDSVAKRRVLYGPHWVIVPQTTTADLISTVQPYVGGKIVE